MRLADSPLRYVLLILATWTAANCLFAAPGSDPGDQAKPAPPELREGYYHCAGSSSGKDYECIASIRKQGDAYVIRWLERGPGGCGHARRQPVHRGLVSRANRSRRQRVPRRGRWQTVRPLVHGRWQPQPRDAGIPERLRKMKCENCLGLGVLTGNDRLFPSGAPSWPCPECGGSGIAHCCEGLQAQPEDERLELCTHRE